MPGFLKKITARGFDMRLKQKMVFFTLLGTSLIGGSACAGANERFSMTTSTYERNSSPDLFSAPDSRILPLSARFETERLVLSGTVSYLQLNGLRGMPPSYDYRWVKSARDDFGAPLAHFVARDGEASITYKVPQTFAGWKLDVTSALKLINGDSSHFSAMRKNYSLQLDFVRELGRFTAEVGTGYRLRENKLGSNFRNGASAYIGGGYQFNPSTKLEMYFDARQGARIGAPNEAEYSAYLSHQLPAKNLSLQAYAFKGLSQAHRNAETGLTLQLRF